MSINLILGIVLSIVSVFVIYLVRKKTGNFAYGVLIALVLGISLGSIFKENIMFLDIFGKGYMSLIKMIIVPLVMTSLITSIIKLKKIKAVRSIGLKSIIILLSTTGVSAIIGLIIANLFKLGNGVDITVAENFVAKEVPSFSKVIMDMLPSNPIASIVDNKIIPVIILSLFIAVAMIIEENSNKDRAKPFRLFIVSAYGVVTRITSIVLEFIPYGVFALIASVFAKSGFESIKSLGLFIIAVYIGAFIIMLIVHLPLVAIFSKGNTIRFFKGIFPAQIMAFTSQSSFGTLPVTIKSLVEGVGIPDRIASFVAPLGSTLGLNGCGGLYPAIVTVFVANAFSVNLNFLSYILIIFTVIISSIGIAGVPGSAVMSTTVVLGALGLPIEGMAIVMAIDPIVDMIRTSTNVTGAAVTAFVVHQTDKDKEDDGIDL